MNSPAIVLAALVCLFALPIAHAAQPAGTIGQLSGIVLAVKPDGRQRILATASRVEVGDTLVSEADSYVRLLLDNGNEAVLGPVTRLKVERYSPQESALALVGGQAQVTGGLMQGAGHRFTLAAGGTTVAVGASSAILSYAAPVDGTLALRQAWLRHSLAAAGTGAMTDGGDNLPLREVVAQATLPLPPRPPTSGLAPGLHVFVVDGGILMSNAGGSQSFNAGQFGYVRNNISPPVIVPNNPGLKFSPPPTFTMNSSPANNSGQPKPDAVDCEVR